MQNVHEVSFDRNDLKALKKLYNTAIEAKKTKNDIIVFRGDKYILGYAKYLIQHLENVFNK